MPSRHVWFENGKLCAVMPALIMFHDVFEPMWRMRGARVFEGAEHTYVCINAPKSGYAVVRTGKGFGRHGREKYYFVDFGARTIKKLVRKPGKTLDGEPMVCVRLPDDRSLYFVVRDGKITLLSTEVV